MYNFPSERSERGATDSPSCKGTFSPLLRHCHPPPVDFVMAFPPFTTTTLRAAVCNCQQLRFIFDEKRMDSLAHFFFFFLI